MFYSYMENFVIIPPFLFNFRPKSAPVHLDKNSNASLVRFKLAWQSWFQLITTKLAYFWHIDENLSKWPLSIPLIRDVAISWTKEKAEAGLFIMKQLARAREILNRAVLQYEAENETCFDQKDTDFTTPVLASVLEGLLSRDHSPPEDQDSDGSFEDFTRKLLGEEVDEAVQMMKSPECDCSFLLLNRIFPDSQTAAELVESLREACHYWSRVG